MDNDFDKPEDQRELARALAWRENEGKVNVFDKPDEQMPSLLGLCHGEKTKAKPTSCQHRYHVVLGWG